MISFIGGVPGENNRLDPSHWQALSLIVACSTPRYKTTYDGGSLTTIVDCYGTDSPYLSALGIFILCLNWPIKKWAIFIENGLICRSYTQCCILI